jgi:K(+)-stimulated pyrophosphate-energized sodium pump
MQAPAVFAFGLVAFGFLGMGPVTIAVDSYGPVTDNAQSVYELSTIEQIPGIQADLKKNYGFDVDFHKAKDHLEENDGAGNTFKATAKPVLIGTAVVGATTMIFAIIFRLTEKAGVTLEPIDPPRTVPAGPDYRRRDDLLVYRCIHAGRDHGRVSRGPVH